MSSATSAKPFRYRAAKRPALEALAQLGCVSIPAGLVVGLGAAIAALSGVQAIRDGFGIVGALVGLAGASMVLRHWWLSRLTLRDRGDAFTVTSGPGGVVGRSLRFDKQLTTAVEIRGSHGNYDLTLKQGLVSVQLGADKDVFPHPYLQLVEWLREHDAHLVERWNYPADGTGRGR